MYTNYKIKSNKDKATFYTSSKEQLPGYIPVEIKDKGTLNIPEAATATVVLFNVRTTFYVLFAVSLNSVPAAACSLLASATN